MTIVEVAERARVLLGTVSRVMNNDIHVAPDTRERVVAMMREMGYVANLVKGMVDGLVLILPRNPADYMDILKNANFPFVLIDHQGTGSLCPAVCALGDAGGEPRACQI